LDCKFEPGARAYWLGKDPNKTARGFESAS